MERQRADTLIYLDDAFLAHDPGPGHPESPARLRAIEGALARAPVPGTRRVSARPATRDELLRVHDGGYLDRLLAHRGRAARLDEDTAVSAGSIDAAWLGAGAAIDAVTRVVAGEAPRAFVFPRPPGHHAERDRALGFCLLSNVALAAAHAVDALGLARVLVVDWDVHHGNGTQHAFEERDDVLFFDTHQHPLYPGSGALDEIGVGAGAGRTINVPLPAGCGGETYLAVFRELLVPAAEAFRPELVLLSAGFDAHAADPLAAMALRTPDFARLAALVRELAERHAGGRLVAVLEGGYALEALADAAHATLDVIAGAAAPEAGTAPPDATAAGVIAAVREQHAGRGLLA